MKKKILALIMVIAMFTSNTCIVKASELENYSEDSVLLDEQYIDADGNQIYLVESSDEFLETENVATNGKKSNDLYENNDTIENAYLYSKVPTISDKITIAGTLYTLGYKAAILSSQTDVDWYKCNFSQGNVIFADIRNIGKKNLNIALYDQSGECIMSSADYPEFTSRPEKYLDYTIPTSGTYYIQISSEGDNLDSYYYFYFGLKYNRTFSYNIKLKGVKITSGSYSSTNIDLRKYFPDSASSSYMQLDNNISTGSSTRVAKKITINGHSYTGTENDGDFYLRNEKLYTTITISGKAENGGMYTWSPNAKGTFTCNMTPFPGNKVR